ncbi:hypothetical protein V3C99_008682, partial [Haemonchus contortus]
KSNFYSTLHCTSGTTAIHCPNSTAPTAFAPRISGWLDW